MILIVILIVLVILFIFLIINFFRSKKILLNCFHRGNVIVFGSKGKGKDLLFQWVINKRKESYFSNISYGGDYHHVDIKKDLDLGITFENLINGNFDTVEKNEEFEGKDIYISDGGTIFPSQYDSKLHKLYPSLPLLYATQRHLFNSNFFINTQALSRIWLALREQADSYIKCRGVIKLPFIRIVKFTYFEKYKSASEDISKMKKRLIENKEVKAVREQYEATHGEIEDGIFILFTKNINYDTRAFHEIIFGKKFTN